MASTDTERNSTERGRKRGIPLSTVSIVAAVALLLGTQISTLISGDNIFDQLTKFKDVLSLAEKYYVDEVDTEELVESAINGMLSDLDPHSAYIPVRQIQRITEEFQGSFEGIGVEFDVINDTLLVVSPVPGGPSEALGILAGDKIVRINDSSSVGIAREDVPKKLRGPKGTRVKVSIHRPGEDTQLEFDIVRDKIPLYTVDVSYMPEPGIGYISVNRFAQPTYGELSEALAKLKADGMKRLVLDLRNNPGGFLEQAVKMASEFLPAGKKIVYTKGRRSESDEDFMSTGGSYTDISLIVLVNTGSASASEIVSGAIQDWDRGLVVGETTFGKGLVQRQFELPDKSAFRLTIARYYTPSGRLIQRPYGEDLATYRRSAGDSESEEGENIDHAAEKDSARPTFKTAAGRTVYGGGGVTPDYIVRQTKLSEQATKILSKGVFQEFTVSYMDRNGKELRARHTSGAARFIADFSVSSGMVDEFLALAKKKGVEIDSAQFAADREYIETRMEAHIARALWGNDGWFTAMRTIDGQLQKALSLFPEADRIAGLR